MVCCFYVLMFLGHKWLGPFDYDVEYLVGGGGGLTVTNSYINIL